MVNYVSDSNLVLDVTIDGEPFPFVTQMTMEAKVNSARSVTCVCSTLDGLDKVRIGAEVILKFGQGDTIPAKDFTGIIRIINPNIGRFSFVAYDYITELANSEIVRFEEGHYKGMDLYMAVADVANYKNVSISKLTKGSGIKIDNTMQMFGYLSRKQFIDNCMIFMVDIKTDSLHPLNAYLPYYYAIRSGKNLEIFQPDHLHNRVRADFTLSLDDATIMDGGLISNYTTVGMVNSCTVVSNIDANLSFTYNDEGSIKEYGVMSRKVDYPTTRKDVLEAVGRLVVQQFKEPTKGYRINLNNAEWIPLGAIIELKSPAVKKSEFLPVVGYKIMINDKIDTVLELGNIALGTDTLIRNFA